MSANDFRLGGFSPALESADHFKIKKSYDLFIGGGGSRRRNKLSLLILRPEKLFPRLVWLEKKR